MSESLWPQLRLEADTEEQLVEQYRQVYLDTYVRDEKGERRTFVDWTNASYRFGAYAFDHAFTESSNYRTSGGVHDAGFSKKRLRRILWIREVLALSAGTVQRFSQSRKTNRGKQVKRRTLVVVEESYVVVFNNPIGNKEHHEFVTAFPADAAYLQRLMRESFLSETKKAAI